MPDESLCETEILTTGSTDDQFIVRIRWPDGRIYKGDWNFTIGMMGEKGAFYWPDGSSY